MFSFIKNFITKKKLPRYIIGFKQYALGSAFTQRHLLSRTGDPSSWDKVSPDKRAIVCLNKLLTLNQSDIPINLLCKKVEDDFNIYDKRAGLTPLDNDAFESHIRQLSAVAQALKSDTLNMKIKYYISQAKIREVSWPDEKFDDIVTNPLYFLS